MYNIAVKMKSALYPCKIGLKLAGSEGEDFWLELFELKDRELEGVKLVISDDTKG